MFIMILHRCIITSWIYYINTLKTHICIISITSYCQYEYNKQCIFARIAKDKVDDKTSLLFIDSFSENNDLNMLMPLIQMVTKQKQTKDNTR